jgi:hypothetical protein
MGPLIAILALAGVAALATHPGASARSHARTQDAAPAAAAATVVPDPVLAAAARDFESRQAELGLVGSAPLFGAEGLPKPTR